MSESARPLVVHPGAIGDLIRLTAMLRALATRWGEACDVVCRHRSAAQIFAGLDSVGELRRFPSRSRPFLASPEQWQLVRWLRARPPSPVYLLEERLHPVVPWSRSTRMEWLLGRAGVPADRVVSVRSCPRRLLEHVVEYELRMAALDPPALTAPGGRRAEEAGPQPELAVSPAEREECQRWISARGWSEAPLVLFQVDARRTNRGRWPDARWAELIRQVLELRPAARALLLGAPNEQLHTRRVAAACGVPRVHDVAGDLPLRRLFALLTLAHSLVSLDTGPAHAAAALRCPVVVLAGRADPRRNRPVGPAGRVEVVTALPEREWPESPHVWFRSHDPAGIPVDAVLAAWTRLLTARPD